MTLKAYNLSIGVHSKLTYAEMVLLHFRCRHASGEPRPSPETPEVAWFPPDEAVRLVDTQPQRDYVVNRSLAER